MMAAFRERRDLPEGEIGIAEHDLHRHLHVLHARQLHDLSSFAVSRTLKKNPPRFRTIFPRAMIFPPASSSQTAPSVGVNVPVRTMSARAPGVSASRWTMIRVGIRIRLENLLPAVHRCSFLL